MKVSDFDYILPAELIAQKPLPTRDRSRLMIINRGTGELKHTIFSQLPHYLSPGDVLVLNDTRVLPARLQGVKTETGGKVEVLLLNQIDIHRWEVLMKPARRLPPGTKITFGNKRLRGVVEERKESGEGRIYFDYTGEFKKILCEIGKVPLPPYIHESLSCPERYQTVYGKSEESVAAPTAGLHFTNSLLRKVEQRGVHLAYVTLRIGLDTFRSVRTREVEQHKIHSERFKVSRESADIINKAKLENRRVIAVGTTAVRAVETAAKKVQGSGLRAQANAACGSEKSSYLVEADEGQTSLFIYPGYKFKIVDGMLTNFHLPKSTLLMMVVAFGGCELVLGAYQEAIARKYRFFSFGDAMLIV